MDKNKFEEVIQKLEIPYDKWIILKDIASIILKGGRGVYPNWSYMRFLFTRRGEILIRHGKSSPYGGRLSPRFAMAYDGTSLSFPPGNPIYPSNYYNIDDVPVLNKGCIIRATDSSGKVLSEAIVSSATYAGNSTSIILSNRLMTGRDALLSFYDPAKMSSENAVHGTEADGIFLNFTENPGHKAGKYGTAHEIIKMKDIEEINLKLESKFKTYKIN